MSIVLFVGYGCSFVVISFVSSMTRHWGRDLKKRMLGMTPGKVGCKAEVRFFLKEPFGTAA